MPWLLSSSPKEVRGAGVVATNGDVTVSSDHLLWAGDDPSAAELEMDGQVVAVVDPDSTRRGMRLVPQKELKLSFLLRTELDILSFLGLYEGSGCGGLGMNAGLLVVNDPGGICGYPAPLGCNAARLTLLFGVCGPAAVDGAAGNSLYVGFESESGRFRAGCPSAALKSRSAPGPVSPAWMLTLGPRYGPDAVMGWTSAPSLKSNFSIAGPSTGVPILGAEVKSGLCSGDGSRI